MQIQSQPFKKSEEDEKEEVENKNENEYEDKIKYVYATVRNQVMRRLLFVIFGNWRKSKRMYADKSYF